MHRLAGNDQDDALTDLPDAEEILEDLEQYLSRLGDDEDDGD